MAPLTPHWQRPSHPEIQHVVINEAEFTSKSLSKVSLPPFAVFAKMAFPPCTLADEPTYATVQIGRSKHLNLNSDLLYINHSCDPTLIFDTSSFNVIVGPKGLKPGDELTFFYPSSEWDMAQPFDCLCGAPTCRGRITGARHMTDDQLAGLWLNGHIHELLEERRAATAVRKNGSVAALKNGSGAAAPDVSENGTVGPDVSDATAQALKDALQQAEKVVVATKAALDSYVQGKLRNAGVNGALGGGFASSNGHHHGGEGHAYNGSVQASQRRGPTSRELSGEMGGDTN